MSPATHELDDVATLLVRIGKTATYDRHGRRVLSVDAITRMSALMREYCTKKASVSTDASYHTGIDMLSQALTALIALMQSTASMQKVQREMVKCFVFDMIKMGQMHIVNDIINEARKDQL